MSPHEAPPGVDDETAIPEDHPRYEDLLARHRIEEGIRKGITHLQGMHAEGRGSAFDYLIGEETIPSADAAAEAAAAAFVLADHPVISVNGNVAALAPEETVALAEATDARIEVNLFHRTEERIERIIAHLEAHGATDILGRTAAERLPGLSHDRGRVSAEGIYAADVVLVPLEDGDRAEALDRMGKDEVVVDLNPLSRSARTADIPIVDNLIRAIPNMAEHAGRLRGTSDAEVEARIAAFDPQTHLSAAEARIREGDLEGV